MTDRELLEFAAKAAGIEIEWFPAKVWDGFRDGYFDATDGSGVFVAGNVEWDPLNDDGDALRLMVKLGLITHPRVHHEIAVLMFTAGMQKLEATRRAIVLAAAAIGKEMP